MHCNDEWREQNVGVNSVFIPWDKDQCRLAEQSLGDIAFARTQVHDRSTIKRRRGTDVALLGRARTWNSRKQKYLIIS